jgi:formylglycine-generating enzyme required for sulfatase activity
LPEALNRDAVRIPAGDFLMGSDTDRADERPQRLVYLDAFDIDRYEVTNAQYERFVKATRHVAPAYWPGDVFPPGQADYPVVAVSWVDANAYCRGVGKRLPTEAEWEKACRGTDGRIYPWGAVWDPWRANVDAGPGRPWAAGMTEPGKSALDDARQTLRATPDGPQARGLRPVGSYPSGAGPYGVMDLAGNASEWVADWYNWEGYWKLPDRNPVGSEPPWNHALRGSSWYDPSGDAGWVRDQSRCSARNSSHAAFEPRAGFRCARSILPHG